MTRSHTTRSGLTLVELLVALSVLAVGVLVLAGSSAVLLHADTLARRSADAAALISARAETVVANGCRATSGRRFAVPLVEAWHVWQADSLHWLADTVRSGGQTLLTVTAVVPCDP